MRARRAVILTIIAASCSPGGAVMCGEGTQQAGSSCIAIDANAPADASPAAVGRYTILAEPKLAASSGVRNRVVVTGTLPDGSSATDHIVLGFNRSGAGRYSIPTLRLGELGATTEFISCDLATPGCAGPLTLTVALASAPTVPVAHVDVELVDPIVVDPARRCLGGGNVLHLEGNDRIFSGNTTITNATFEVVLGFGEVFSVKVTPTGGTDAWTLTFDTRVHIMYLGPAAYENAGKAVQYSPYGIEELDHPAIDVSGFGNSCSELSGRFVVRDYTLNGNGVQNATFSFEQYCEGSTTAHLSGCIHYQP
ncbi:MAG: hypothetical protein H0T46_36735 [Deltaproteobacteria bacterium]|nr:hypothetical protein [Deltaproteobacteria bacterium]